MRKKKKKDTPTLIYEVFVALLVLAALIYCIVTGDIPDTSSDF